MSSESSLERPGLALLLGLAAGACTQRVDATAVLAFGSDSTVSSCLGDLGPELQPDLVRVAVYAYRGVDLTPYRGGSVCARCGVSDPEERAPCERIGPPQCICGPNLDSNAALAEAFALTSLGDVPPDTPLCLQVLTLPGGGGGGLRDCSAEPACVDDEGLTERASICGYSSIFELGGETGGTVVADRFNCAASGDVAVLCREASCACSFDDYGVCTIDAEVIARLPERNELRQRWEATCTAAGDPCPSEVRRGCVQNSAGCLLARVGSLSTAECASF